VFPPLNASLNATSGCLIVLGFVFIKRKAKKPHALCMLLTVLPLPVHPVEHPVDQDAGDRYIKPNGKGDSGNPGMCRKIASERPNQRHQHKRRDQYSAYGMRDQHREINRPDPTVVRKRRRAMMKVVIKVRD